MKRIELSSPPLGIAVEFKGKPSVQLEMAMANHDVKLADEPVGIDATTYFIDGDEPEDSLAIHPGDFFVSYGPWWDVFSPEQFAENFNFKSTEDE